MLIEYRQGTIRQGAAIDANLVREAHIYFEILCERFPKSPLVSITIPDERNYIVAVADPDKPIGLGRAFDRDRSVADTKDNAGDVMRFRYEPVPRGSAAKAPDAAVAVLKRTDNPAVGWGDAVLLHEIAEEMGWPHESWFTEKRVLDAIDRHNKGQLVKRYIRLERLVRVFYLPECVPAPRKRKTE